MLLAQARENSRGRDTPRYTLLYVLRWRCGTSGGWALLRCCQSITPTHVRKLWGMGDVKHTETRIQQKRPYRRERKTPLEIGFQGTRNHSKSVFKALGTREQHPQIHQAQKISKGRNSEEKPPLREELLLLLLLPDLSPDHVPYKPNSGCRR